MIRSRWRSTATELRQSVAHVEVVPFDAATTGDVDKTITQCSRSAGEAVDLVIVAVGELGAQETDEADPDRIAQMVTVNFTWPAAALSAVAAHLTRQGHGRMVVLSSVAGYRVRRSNYVYGSAKAGLDGFALGLGESLRGTGVTVHVVRPGFVRTKMTAGRSPAPFAVGPERVAADIVRGLGARAGGHLDPRHAEVGVLHPGVSPPIPVAAVARLGTGRRVQSACRSLSRVATRRRSALHRIRRHAER